jgi:mannose-6-phosphate isomerase-like protein (cupin superfamily)
MDLKPSDIFIGVIDFFSVMLPGALLTFFLEGMFYDQVFGGGRLFPEPATEIAKAAVFLIVAYIVGNLIFMLASFLDYTYDGILRQKWFQSKYDLNYKTALQVREKFIRTDLRLRELYLAGRISEIDYRAILDNPKREIFNTFKWSQHFLLFNKSEALADIQRIEADSKFFRSLVIAFLIIAVLLFVQVKILLAVLFIAFALLCYYRYGELRFKATEKAYELISTFFYQKPEEAVTDPLPDTRPQNSSALKRDLTADFSARHRELILFLTRGLANQPKRITLAQGESRSTSVIADANDSWYCLEGRGSLQPAEGTDSLKTLLLPQAIVPIVRGNRFSLRNDGNQPLEILVFEK